MQTILDHVDHHCSAVVSRHARTLQNSILAHFSRRLIVMTLDLHRCSASFDRVLFFLILCLFNQRARLLLDRTTCNHFWTQLFMTILSLRAWWRNMRAVAASIRWRLVSCSCQIFHPRSIRNRWTLHMPCFKICLTVNVQRSISKTVLFLHVWNTWRTATLLVKHVPSRRRINRLKHFLSLTNSRHAPHTFLPNSITYLKWTCAIMLWCSSSTSSAW